MKHKVHGFLTEAEIMRNNLKLIEEKSNPQILTLRQGYLQMKARIKIQELLNMAASSLTDGERIDHLSLEEQIARLFD